MLRRITHELKHHAPFTALGTAAGVAVLLLLVFANVPATISQTLFQIFHPLHVLLSAMVTTAMYRLHARARWWTTLLIGYLGSVGIATLSDCVIPYFGEVLLGMEHAHVHAGFIEEWYVVNPLALLGIGIGVLYPRTKFPHAVHVLLSTFASLFHIAMAAGAEWDAVRLAAVAGFLFLAVWIPCCTSDIVFPLLFVRKEDRPPCRFCEKHAAEHTKPNGDL